MNDCIDYSKVFDTNKRERTSMPLRTSLYITVCLLVFAQSIGQEDRNIVQNPIEKLSQFQNLEGSESRLTFFSSNIDELFENNSAYDWLETVNVYLASAEKTNDSLAMRRYKTVNSELYFHLKDYTKSLLLANEVYEVREKLDKEHLKLVLDVLDRNYEALKMFDKQIEIRTVKRVNGFTENTEFYDVYEKMELYRRAMNQYIMAKGGTIDENDNLGKAEHNNKIGNYLRLDNSPSTAINEFNKASGYLEVYMNDITSDKSQKAVERSLILEHIINGNIGKSLVDLGNYVEALPYLKESVEGLKKENPNGESEIIDNSLALAQANIELGYLRSAKRILDIEFEELSLTQEQMRNRLFGKYYERIENYRNAATYYSLNDRILDSLRRDEQSILKQQLGVIVGASDVENQIQINEEQRAELEKVKGEVRTRDERYNLVIISLIFTLLGFAGLIFAYLNSIKNQRLIEKQKFIIEDSLKEKESLLKEIHHRVKNNLQMVSSLLSLQTKNTKDKSAIIALEEGKSRVKAMALIHQKLYQNEDLSIIEMQGYIESLINSVQSVYKKGGHNISITIDAEGTELDIDRAIPFGLILNELVSNTFKYAFPKSDENGKIYIHLSKNGSGGHFEYSDNGVGLPDEMDERTNSSMGIRLINRLVNQLQSQLNIDKNAEGVRFWFDFA